VSHWTCDEVSGVRYDSSATSTNDLTDNNTVGSAVGLLDNACDFERANSEYLSIGDASQVGLDFTGGEFTFSWWSKPETVIGTIINKYLGSSSQRSYQISNGANMDLWVCATSSGASCLNSIPNSFMVVGTWKHQVVSYSVNTDLLKYYVNGVKKSSTTTTMSTLYNGSADFIIGTNNGTNYVDGLVDEITAFNYDLTDAEVTTLYNSGTPLEWDTPTPSQNEFVPVVLSDMNGTTTCEHTSTSSTCVVVGYDYSLMLGIGFAIFIGSAMFVIYAIRRQS